MPNQSYSCLSVQVLEQIGQNEVSPDELLNIEEHVSECDHCRELFESAYSSSQWCEHIRPALSDLHLPASSTSDDEAHNPSAILKLLGPTDDPNMLGRIGNYEIVGVIGQGGMGAVFKGFDRSLNRFVAIKMLLPHLAASGAARKRFAREGQAVAAVVDDYVMAIHCVDQWQGIPYLVMTYSRGVSLQKRLNDNGPLEIREILRIGMQAAKGLAAAHAQGIVHRDIKPSNILLDQNVERVQLVDFGLARAVDDASLTCSGTLAGTPQYMSPEQARAETVDHRSDLFSLGSVFYAMCVGHAPFRAESSYSVLRLIIDKEPRPIREVNTDVPEWLCAIIEKLMSKCPEDRYASADQVGLMMEQCLAHVQHPMQHALPPVKQDLNGRGTSMWMSVSRLQRWFPMMNDKRIIALISLVLLLIALLAPWPIATSGNLEVALAFAGSAALLSLGLALLSRSEYFSRIVLWSVGVTLGLAVIGIGIVVPIQMLRNAKGMEQKAEAAKIRADKAATKQEWAAPGDKQVNRTNAIPNDPFKDAVDLFNQRMRQMYPKHDQPLLTKDELIACASWNGERSDKPSETLKACLSTIARQHQLPEKWSIDGRYIDLPPEATPVRAFQIFLQRDDSDERFTIRERFLAPPENFAVTHVQNEQDGGLPLASAIKRFNAGKSSADGMKQPPLTEDEVVAAIIHKQTTRDDLDVSNSLFERFQNIARTRHLPKGATLEVIPTFGVEGGSTYTIWSIRLEMLQDEIGKEGWTHGFGIREQFVSVKHRDADAIHWGTPATNGLQAGVRLSPPLLSYQIGQKISVDILYRNILTKPMPATVPNVLDYEVDAQDTDGAKLDVVDPQVEKTIGGWRAEHIGDEPITFRGRPIVLMPSTLSPEERTKLLSKANDHVAIFIKPGQSCRLHFTVSNYASDAKGTLNTGDVEIAVDAIVSQNLPTPDNKGDSATPNVAGVKQQKPAAGLRIVGKCVDENGMPIKDALIDLYLNADAHPSIKTHSGRQIRLNTSRNLNADTRIAIKTVRTQDDGAFDLGAFPDPELSAGSDVSYIVVGRAKGKAIGYGVPFGYSVDPSALQLVLGVPGQLKGTITGPDGSPIKNARVKKPGIPWIEGVHGATTNEAGEYVLEGVPLLEHPGFVRKIIPGSPGRFENIPKSLQFLIVEHPVYGSIQPAYAECPSTVDGSFDQPAAISGRVVDEKGMPIVGINVFATPSRNPAHRVVFAQSLKSGFSYYSTETNADGEYSMLLQHDGPVEIGFRGSKQMAKTVSDILAKPGESTIVPDVTAVAPAMVVGRIVDVDTDNTVACPAGVRLRVNAMGDGALRSVVVQPDGTYRLPVLPGKTFVYFSLSPDSLREFAKKWDVLDHPNPLTATQFPVEANSENDVKVNFPVQLNNDKLGEDLKCLQGVWEIQSGTYVESGNARLPLTSDRLLDGDQRPLRFTIRGNQWIGHSRNFCSALEPELGLSLCAGIAELTLDARPSPQSLMLTRFENGSTRVYQCVYHLNGEKLELVCNSSAMDELPPQSPDSLQQAFVLNAKRLENSSPSLSNVIVRVNGNQDNDAAQGGPKMYSPREAMDIVNGFGNADHGKPIGVTFRVESVHPPFGSEGGKDPGHTKSEMHLDCRPLPADFKEHQFLVVLTKEAIDQLHKLGIKDIEAHFHDKEIEATGRVLSTTYTARGMRGDHYHLIVSDLKQIAFSKKGKELAPPK